MIIVIISVCKEVTLPIPLVVSEGIVHIVTHCTNNSIKKVFLFYNCPLILMWHSKSIINLDKPYNS